VEATQAERNFAKVSAHARKQAEHITAVMRFVFAISETSIPHSDKYDRHFSSSELSTGF
jgi:hypothetical protein